MQDNYDGSHPDPDDFLPFQRMLQFALEMLLLGSRHKAAAGQAPACLPAVRKILQTLKSTQDATEVGWVAPGSAHTPPNHGKPSELHSVVAWNSYASLEIAAFVEDKAPSIFCRICDSRLDQIGGKDSQKN